LGEEQKDAPKMFEFGGADDYQLRQAVNFLQDRPVKKNDPSLVAKAESAAAAKNGKAGAKAADGGIVTPDSKIAPPAEKKTPPNPGEVKVERYRLTPGGLIKTP
jgi:carboxyl-terminal processing protease